MLDLSNSETSIRNTLEKYYHNYNDKNQHNTNNKRYFEHYYFEHYSKDLTCINSLNPHNSMK